MQLVVACGTEETTSVCGLVFALLHVCKWLVCISDFLAYSSERCAYAFFIALPLQRCHCKFHIILRVHPLRIIAIVCKISNFLCACVCATNKFGWHSLVIVGNTNALVACGMWHYAYLLDCGLLAMEQSIK